MGGRIDLLAEIDSSIMGGAGGLVHHVIAAEIPLDIAPTTLLHESTRDTDSELEVSESESESRFSGWGSELLDTCWGGGMRLGASLGRDACWYSGTSSHRFFPFATLRSARINAQVSFGASAFEIGLHSSHGYGEGRFEWCLRATFCI